MHASTSSCIRSLQELERRLTWGDRLLIVGLLALAVYSVPWFAGASASVGRTAIVKLEGQVIAQLPLHRNGEYSAHGPAGETVLEVRAGRVRAVRSPGAAGICVRRGWIAKPGEMLICLPNRLTVEIPGESSYDATTR